MRASLVVALAYICPAITCTSLYAAPFPTGDQNPLLNGFEFAPNSNARLPANGDTFYSATLNWSSTAILQESPNEDLIVDSESQELRLSFSHAFAKRLTVRLQVPFRSSSGGNLDGFVDRWHALFGLPNGDRTALPQNQFLIGYESAGQTLAHYSDGDAGLGDLSLAGGYQLRATTTHATSLWLNIKVPTGNSPHLGSGATDVALSLAHEQQLSSRWYAYTQLNIAYLGTGELLPQQQRNSIASGMLAFDYRHSPALSLTAQLDGHTAAFTGSNLDLFGAAWILTVGGEYRWESRWYVQLGVSEDVKVEASPDVNFVLAVGKAL